MKVCPKCRKFYDQTNLKYCLDDGLPLLQVDQQNEIWEIGRRFLENNRKIVKRQTRISTTKKVLGYFVTTIVFSAVIAVIAINTIISLTPNSDQAFDDQAKFETPERLIDVEIESSETPTKTSTYIETPTPTPTQTPTKTPLECNSEKRKLEKKQIRVLIDDLVENDINAERLILAKQHFDGDNIIEKVVWDKKYDIEISISNECTQAGVNVKYKLNYELFGHPQIAQKTSKYNCKRIEKWVCQGI